jgi:hypothetical protein
MEKRKSSVVERNSFRFSPLPSFATTADRYWSCARAWLHAELKKGALGGAD